MSVPIGCLEPVGDGELCRSAAIGRFMFTDGAMPLPLPLCDEHAPDFAPETEYNPSDPATDSTNSQP